MYSWLRDAGERAATTFAETFLAVVGADVFNVWSFDWKTGTGLALGAALLSFLKSMAARRWTNHGTASLVVHARSENSATATK